MREDHQMVRFGIIGAGEIAHKFAEAAGMVGGCELAAVAARDGERAEAFAGQWKIPHHFGSYRELLASGSCDVVYLATTNQTHRDLALMVLDAGHHLLCEKPLALRHRDAREILSRAGERGLFAMETLWSLFLPTLNTARRWVREGLIGKVHMAGMMVSLDAPADHRVRSPELGGGILYDLGVYPLHILPFLLDTEIRDVRAIVKRDDDGIDVADLIVLDLGGCLASVHLSMDLPMTAPSVLCGEKGSIYMHGAHKARRVEARDPEGRIIGAFEDPFTNGFEHQIAHVLQCLARGETESPVVSHRASLRCAEIFDQVLA